jgi:hypothetical protein
MVPVLGQTVVGFSGDNFIFLAKLEDGDIVVRCPVTLKVLTFPPSFFVQR